MKVQLFDTTRLGEARLTTDGYLVTSVRAARTGVQEYFGHELGLKDKRKSEVIRVYRPEEEVFKRDAMESFSNIPVTLDHPPELVGPGNWTKYARGFTGEGVARDGGFVVVPLALKDAGAIKAVMVDGRRELSFGYTCELEFKDGVTPEGQPYNAIQSALHGNHLAIVKSGRAGKDCRIGDDADDDNANGGDFTMELKKVLIDGIPVPITDEGAVVVDTLQKRIATAEAARVTDVAIRDKEIADLRKELADKDKELGSKDVEIKELKDKQITAADLDKLATERATIIGDAKIVVADFDPAGLSLPDIRKGVVAKSMGDDKVKGRSDDYIHSCFDSLVEKAKGGSTTTSSGGNVSDREVGDALQQAFRGFTGTLDSTNNSAEAVAFNEMKKRNADAWKPKLPQAPAR